MTTPISTFKCSFCDKTRTEVKKLVAGLGHYICDECINRFCDDLSAEGVEVPGREPAVFPVNILTPKEIKARLDEYVIHQDHAKKVLSVAVYNHYKRISSPKQKDITLEKSNVLLIGPTGTGKTLLAQTLARILDVPFAIADATNITEAGYVGDDVENILVNLLHAADQNINRAIKGIIYIDEIDKIAKKGQSASITRDVSGEGVQQALLKIIEGTISAVPPKGGRKHPQQEFVYIDTTDILFICGGAFVGLEDVIQRRVAQAEIGFNADVQNKEKRDIATLYAQLQPEDLLQYGLLPEFVGRLPVVATLHPLNEEAMVKILTEPKNALIKQYKQLFAMDKVKVEFTEEALQRTAQLAMDKKAGARGLRGILENAMLPSMFIAPTKKDLEKIVVTPDMIDAQGSLESIDSEMEKLQETVDLEADPINPEPQMAES